MRDTISLICNELMSGVLPLLRPTANNSSNMEPGAECYQINERATESHNLSKFTFLGYFIGWAFYSVGSLNLELPSAFWARLCGGLNYIYCLEDLRSQDTLLAASLQRIDEAAKDMSELDFNAVYGETAFVLETSQDDGSVIELCPGGSSKALTRENASEYIDLYLRAYTEQDSIQFRKLYQAFEDVGTKKVLSLINPQIVKRRICSSAIIDLESFKASTSISEDVKEFFWQVVEEMSNDDR